jgi:hypothetical protein
MQEKILIDPDISPTFPVSISQQAPSWKKRREHKFFPDTFPVSPACLSANR